MNFKTTVEFIDEIRNRTTFEKVKNYIVKKLGKVIHRGNPPSGFGVFAQW